MSIFQETVDQTGAGQSALTDLVGDGKKFKTTEELAKAKQESDRFIEKLQNEAKELRAELGTRLTVEEALKKAQEAGVVESPKPTVSTPTPQVPQKGEDLEKQILQAIEKRDRTKTIETNLDIVTNKMVQIYGTVDKAGEVISSKAKELGMTAAQLQNMAAENPKAFFKLVGVEDKPAQEQPKTSSWGNAKNPAAMKATTGHTVTQPGTYKYYQELRKSDPAAYFSPRVQLQMDKDAREKGEAFYS